MQILTLIRSMFVCVCVITCMLRRHVSDVSHGVRNWFFLLP